MDRVLQRRDTASNWAKFNPVLSEGEIGIVIDGGKGYKVMVSHIGMIWNTPLIQPVLLARSEIARLP